VSPDTLDDILVSVSTAAFALLGFVSLRYWDQRRERPSHLWLAVEDHGGGVPADFVEGLFERFSRSDEARARGLGSGLGLAIARSYAQAHGGELLYVPLRPHGSRFELIVPVGNAYASPVQTG
jgi:signal transduction histidine kinase